MWRRGTKLFFLSKTLDCSLAKATEQLTTPRVRIFRPGLFFARTELVADGRPRCGSEPLSRRCFERFVLRLRYAAEADKLRRYIDNGASFCYAAVNSVNQGKDMRATNQYLPKKFFLKEGNAPEREVTLEEFQNAEARAGFRPKPGLVLATGGFSSRGIGVELVGRVEY